MKYRSKFEQKLAEGPLKGVPYEANKVPYQVIKDCTYTPDWTIDSPLGYTYYVEAKGRFQQRNGEPYKYLDVRKSLTWPEELVFLFQQPHKPMPNAKTRKDGTKLTHAEWATKNGFRWFDEESIKELL